MYKNYLKRMMWMGSIMLLTVSACKKDEAVQIKEVSLDLPETLTLTYGEQKSIALPAESSTASKLNFALDFSETPDLQVREGKNLREALKEAVVIDEESGEIQVDSRILYPNNAASVTSDAKIPASYQITVTAGSEDGTLQGKQTIGLTINSGSVTVKDATYNEGQAFAYVLYGAEDTGFDLETGELSTEGTTWYLPEGAGAEVSKIEGNQIAFIEGAGDPEGQQEQAYTLEPTLLKDGFPVATTQFKVTFIPQIKFLFGAYYPEYDLTIYYNYLQIGLSGAYRSSPPAMYPDKYKGSFSLVSIEKNGVAFQDTQGFFSVDSETGAVLIKEGLAFSTGDAYKFIVKATTSVGLEFTADLTLVLNKLEE